MPDDIVFEGYKPFLPEARPDTKFAEGFQCECVTTIARFKELTDGLSNVLVAFDSETKSLDFSVKEPVVGVSWSTTAYNGYYVPLRHKIGQNFEDVKQFWTLWFEFLKRNRRIGYNVAFDLMMFQAEGLDITQIPSFEVMALVYNADTNVKTNGLKWAAKYYLGRSPKTFEETVGKHDTFDMISPQEGYYYACCDTANTMGLYQVLGKAIIAECPKVVRIDNRLANMMPRILSNDLTIDSEEMKGMYDEMKAKKDAIETEIFKHFGGEFINLDSKPQLSNLFDQLGIDTGERTASGYMKLDDEHLSKIDHPVGKLLSERASLTKQLSSYVEKLSTINVGHVAYDIFRVPTGRLASGNRKNPYFLMLNYQNLTKPHPAVFEAIESDEPGNVLGWKFIQCSKKDMQSGRMYVEGYDPHHNVRRAITVPNKDEWYFASVDYKAEELLIASQFSRDPIFCEAFETGDDLHKKVAIEMFGAANYDNSKRKKAKMCNFGLLYGGSASVLANVSNIPLKEAQELFDSYWKTMKVLGNWRKFVVSEAYRHSGVVYTAFGRPRRLKSYLTSPISKIRTFGERSVCSHMIQGTGGDVIRIVLVELFNQLFIPYPDRIRFVGCVHDEVDVAIRKDSMELLDKMMQIMCVKPPGFRIPLQVDPEIGYSYGEMWGFEKDKTTGKWSPCTI